MKTSFISDLGKDGEVTDFFMVSEATVRAGSNGSYVAMTVADKTGKIDCRVWGSDTVPGEPGDVIKLSGILSVYRDKLQIKVLKTRLAKPEEFDIADFLKASRFDRDIMYEQLLDIVHANVTHPLLEVVLRMVQHNQLTVDRFKKCPAAKSMHHAFIGGLLEHTLSMAGMAVHMSAHYGLDTNVMVACCVFHDIGKLYELDADSLVFAYTHQGSLLGHILIGVEHVSKVMDQLGDQMPWDLRMRVLHIIASHHGELEWGAAKLPSTREAIAFHYLDNLDSKMGVVDRLLADDQMPGPFTAYEKGLESFLLKGEAKT